MRFVVLGAGAIGGVVGARLGQAGHEVVLIARGAHYEAIAASGLTLETPRERVTLPVAVVPAPDGVDFAPEDVVLLATKSQDTAAALQSLRRAAPGDIPIVCLQNGVENERVALRLFDDVYGAVVMAPTAHLEPGVVQAFGAAITGQIDVGRYPDGVDDRCRELCDLLGTARFESAPRPDIMRHKYAKLVLNLGNSVQAICGDDRGAQALMQRAQDEGRSVLRAAGIEFEVEGVSDLRGRWESWQVEEIAGRKRGGGSTWQSVVRGAGSVETDYLNGEIALQGRLLGLPTPVNALLQSLARETALEGRQPGWLTADEVLARL
ncbi:MAG TPA: 2-dehydropantoate 2-reductase [Solirubrobacteraceae bacterium]|nr:2-dehydropantoate 2-reductase [Solirubrobacteraceae bacterium]